METAKVSAFSENEYMLSLLRVVNRHGACVSLLRSACSIFFFFLLSTHKERESTRVIVDNERIFFHALTARFEGVVPKV